jgi:hypothetical protein
MLRLEFTPFPHEVGDTREGFVVMVVANRQHIV